MKKIILLLIIASLAIVYSVKAIEIYPNELVQLMGESNLGASVLHVYQGGTGAGTFTSGECLVGNGTDPITTQACGSGGGGGGGIFSTSSILAWYDDNPVVIGATATGTANTMLEVDGNVAFWTIASGTWQGDAISSTYIEDAYLKNDGDTATGDYTFDTKLLFLDATGDEVGIATTTPSYELDVDGTIRAWDNLLVGNTAGSASFRGQGDIYASDGIKAMGGLYTEAKKYGAGVEVLNYDHTTTYTNAMFADATFASNTSIMTDSHGSFGAATSSYEGAFMRIIGATPDIGGATAEIKEVLSDTELALSMNTAGSDTLIDLTGVSFVVYDHPIFFAGDNGFMSSAVAEAEFHVSGTGFHGFYIEDTAMADQHQALTVDTDIKDYTGIVGGNYLMYTSSSSANAISAAVLALELDEDNITNSHLSYIDIVGLGGNSNGNDVDVMHIEGLALTDHIIHQGSPDVIQAAYYDNGAGTTASSTLAFNSASTDITLFENDNSIIYIGSDTEFTSIGYALSTNGTRIIYPEYYYCTGDNTWVTLPSVTDTTNSEKITGTISFPNPGDRGKCDEEIDTTAFADTTDLYYVAIKRTRDNYATQKPIESRITISGGGDFMYLDSYGLKPVASAGAPYSCDGTHTGKWYYDSSATALLWCTGSAWVAFAETADVTVHNNLTGIQGGTATEYYHLTSAEYTELQAGYLTLTAWFSTTSHALMATLPSLVTVGTIGTGVWQGTDIGVEYGGTGVSTLTDGGVILGSGTGAVTVLPRGGNGAILIGEDGSDPSMANITETGDALVISNGAASIDFSVHATLEAVADSSYTGDNAITTVGTIGTGVWEGTAIDFSAYTNATADTGIKFTADAIGFDCSEVEGTGINCATEAITLDTDAVDARIVATTTVETLTLTGQTFTSCYAFASTTAIISGFIKKLGGKGKDITVQSHSAVVDDGTTLVINLSDGTNDMNSITASTTENVIAVDTNNVFTNDTIEIQYGTNTGSVTKGAYCIYYKQN